MNRLVAWLKLQWSEFLEDPIDYGIENGISLIVMAIGLWILLTCARCAGGILGL